MKKLITVIALSTTCLLFTQSKSLDPVANYYFCYSKEVPRQNDSGKLKLVYTDVRIATGNEEREIQTVLQKFGHFISQNCSSTNETCTSDLNRYYTAEQAEQHRQELLNKYKKLGNYELSRIEFSSFE
ncbi:hypothetical protein [Spirosoma sp. KUDC1026]|uniref:hypothetical protein n=1 Tax=Spirosoma sp. KUDC1026 TaxID=2745947 RepID=UPI00159BD21F|nr:hypothetical protein [Spirosoma sp. KUDC1026]QKZ13363.1 hypothetical protein HU175_12250 [Spirosoma sp. KUDC1026]